VNAPEQFQVVLVSQRDELEAEREEEGNPSAIEAVRQSISEARSARNAQRGSAAWSKVWLRDIADANDYVDNGNRC